PSVYAQSTERYGFETGTQGWVPSTYQYGQAITAVAQSSDRAVVGTYSLKMTTNLIGGSSTNASGEAYVDMRYNPPSGVIAPVDLQAQTVTAYVYCPTGSRGNPSAPNGVQIFVKDQNFNSLYGSWINIVENTWMQLTMTVNNAGAFDSTKVIVVGFKIGAGTGSTATYSGPLYLDVVSFDIGTPEQPSPTNQRYDFETGTQGWTYSTYQYGLAVTSVQQSATRAALGTYSLQLNTNLIGGSQTNSNGEAYVDMRYTPPSGVSAPVNLNGVPVTIWVYCPTGSRGDNNNPNGIQIFVKDETWKSEYSTWVNIFENVWFKVTLIPSTTAPQNGWMDAGFDPTKIISVGVKIGAGTGSTATYNGPIYADVFAFPQPGVPLSDYIYNFNDAGALNGIPRWNVDPGWGAQAWSSVYLSNNALTADAAFNIATDPQRKGYVNIFYAPPIYLTNKDNHTIRAEIKFDPQPGPFDFAGTLWVYDKQNERWYQNDYKSIGGGIGWNV
ncbi:MAG: hypothetical protein Q8O36_00725, partial [Candidatus Omnitrophota bacterium]|nr:hypothetical protein [Candidatus Omnitrophota bacterium]